MQNVRPKLKTIKTEKGITVFEAILAIAIVFLILPFAYTKINSTTEEIQDISLAKYIQSFSEPIVNYIKINENTWESLHNQEISSSDFLSELKEYGLSEDDIKFKDSIKDYSVIINKTTNENGGSIVNAYLVIDFNKDFNQIRLAKIAKQLGSEGGIVGPDGMVHSVLGGWSLESKGINDKAFVYKIDTANQVVQNLSYLHRLKMGSRSDLNKMETTLYLGDAFSKYNIAFTKDVFGNLLQVSRDIATYVLNANSIETDVVYFSDGATFDFSKNSEQGLKIEELSVNGVLLGEANNALKTKNLFGAINLDNLSSIKNQNYHQQGSIIANSVKFSDDGKIIVGRLLDLSGISSSDQDEIDTDENETEKNEVITTFNYMETNSLYLNYLTAMSSASFSNGLILSSGGGIYFCSSNNCDFTENNNRKFIPIISTDDDLESYFIDLNKLNIRYVNSAQQIITEDYISKLKELNTSTPRNINKINGNWR